MRILILCLAICTGCMSMGRHMAPSDSGPFVRYKTYYAWLTYPVYEIVVLNSMKHKLPVPLVLALIDAESDGNTYAVSHCGARGLTQVMARYHYKGNPRDLHDPRINIAVGTRYLAQCRRLANNDLVLTLRNYERGLRGKGINTRYTLEIMRHLRATT